MRRKLKHESAAEESVGGMCISADRAAEALNSLRAWLEARMADRVAELGGEGVTVSGSPAERELWGMRDQIDACEAAVAVFRALDEEGVSDAGGVKDLVFDYRKQAAELKLIRGQVRQLENLRDGLAHSLRRAKEEAGGSSKK